MGNPLGIFKNLTKAGIVTPDGVQYFDSPAQQAQAIVSQQQAPEFTANVDAPIPEQGSWGIDQANAAPMGIEGNPEPDNQNFLDYQDGTRQTSDSPTFAQSSPEKDVAAIHPSFNQQTRDQYGNVISGNNKGLTKGGLFMKILAGGLQGGMDAIANGALNAPQHGESSFGMGMQAARQGPQIRQQEAIAKQQGEMQTAQMQDQMRPVQTKQGVMPLWKAVQLSKMTREEAAAAKDSALAEKALREPKPDMPDLQKLYADAVRRGDKVAAQNYADAIQNIQPEHQAKEQGRDDKAIAIEQKRASGQPLTPDEVAYDAAYKKWVKENKVDPGVARMQVLVNARQYAVEDPSTGAMTYVNPNEIAQSKKDGTPLYAKGTNFQKNALTPKARFDDIARVTKATDDSVGALDQGDGQRALIYQALRDPESVKMGAVQAMLHSKAYQQMNPASRNYVTSILSLREQIMGANQMLTGAAGTSDGRVQAIWNTLPNGTEPDSDMARRKMTQVHGMIDNLKEAFPLVDTVNKAQQKNAPKAEPKSSGTTTNKYGGFDLN